jgi:hypothetical protein
MAPSPASVVVFLGPSVSRQEAQSVLPANFQPPARKGDFYRLLASGVEAFILIDGVFHAEPSVWQREILEALSDGIPVIGASSMGALRAAELHTLGMVGHGTIFGWYRDDVLDGDDEVALLHGAADAGYRALSEPLVNIRYNLQRAVEAGALAAPLAQQLIEESKSLHYPRRSYGALLEGDVLRSAGPAEAASLRRFLQTERVDLKRQDALSALRAFAQGAFSTPPPDARPEVGRTGPGTFTGVRLAMRPLPASLGLPHGQRVSEAMGAGPLAGWRRELNARWFLGDWARARRLSVPPLPAPPGGTASSTWRVSRGLTRREHEACESARGLVDWLRRTGPTQFGLRADDRVDVPFLADWARTRGVEPRRDSPIPDAELSEWMLEKGPGYFGFAFDLDLELRLALQMGELSLPGSVR